METEGFPISFLVLDKLTKRYGDFHAVDDLTLSVADGEFIALLGPSGCGKTTTLQMIAGFVEPTSGGIALDGRDLIAVKPSQRGLGIVFQSYALFPHMTAAENIGFGLEMRGIGRAERDKQITEALSLVGLSALADRYPRRMSGGQQQRVALARALVVKPRVLLLDEPLSNLDAKLREEMQIELRKIQRTLGTTTILVTHDQGEAMALADRIVVMNTGRAEQIGAPEETYEWPKTAFVASFLGKTNVFEGKGDPQRGTISVEDMSWPWPDAPAGALHVSVRPEKLHFAKSASHGIDGRVTTCIFQGNHWLYEIEAGGRLLTLIQQNTGGTLPREGDQVRLDWRAEDMRLHPGDEAAS